MITSSVFLSTALAVASAEIEPISFLLSSSPWSSNVARDSPPHSAAIGKTFDDGASMRSVAERGSLRSRKENVAGQPDAHEENTSLCIVLFLERAGHRKNERPRALISSLHDILQPF